MALIKCKECSKDISDKAAACPHCGIPLKQDMQKTSGSGCLTVIAWGVGIILFILLSGSLYQSAVSNSSVDQASGGNTLSEKYPGPWMSEFNADIAKALAKNNVAGCGEFKYRQSAEAHNEFLVYCTGDGQNFASYLVWASSGDVMGPYKAAQDLK